MIFTFLTPYLSYHMPFEIIWNYFENFLLLFFIIPLYDHEMKYGERIRGSWVFKRLATLCIYIKLVSISLILS